MSRSALAVSLLAAAVLAVTSLVQDSITFDETKHFAAGMSYWHTGDYRLAPDTPPLAQMLVTLPALLVPHVWPDADAPGWRTGDVWPFGQHLLYSLNDGARWIVPARCTMVGLLLATCWLVQVGATRLYGRPAGLVALTVACLSPSLLAHGRLVTTDLPITLTLLSVLIAFACAFKRMTLKRLFCACIALSAATLTKFSWPLALPAVGVMACIAVMRRTLEPATGATVQTQDGACGADASRAPKPDRRKRLLAALATVLSACLFSFVAIWACFGLRFSPFSAHIADAGALLAQGSQGVAAASGNDEAWDITLQDSSGKALTGMTAWFARWGRARHILPEAYLFGLALTRKTVESQPAYLLGKSYEGGRWHYFPIAFAIKTPISLMLLLVLAAVGVRRRRVPCRDPILLGGILTFVATYLLAAMTSGVNLGHRHLLPIYPPLIMLAGSAVCWLGTRIGRWLVWTCLAWLAWANVSIYPDYLAYFNEAVGGPGHGHKYLADSNIDWGQDLRRLARFSRAHPETRITLAYFGSAKPRAYGLDCAALPSQLSFVGAPAPLTAGTYIVSVTQLHGVHTRQIRDAFWASETNRRQYRQAAAWLSQPAPRLEDAEGRSQRAYIEERYRLAQQWLLLNRLQDREPDGRIGWSMFVYELTQDEIEDLIRL